MLMPTEASHRAPLESMTPAVIGIGFLHVLGIMLIWIVLPLLSGNSKSSTTGNVALVWRAPDDFTEEAAYTKQTATGSESNHKSALPILNGELMQSSDVAVPALKQAPQNKEVNGVATAPTTNLARIEFSAVANNKALTARSPVEILTAHQSVQPVVIPQNTLSKLEMTAGPAGQDLLWTSVATTIQSSPVTMAQPAKADPLLEFAAPPKPMVTSSGREANKYITLSAIHDIPIINKPTLGLLDIARLNEAEREQQKALRSSGLDSVERSLQQTLLRAWMPPSINLVPDSQRRVSVELTILRDGRVQDVVVKTPSGSEALDASVRAALARVTKIPESLPASYPKERYAVRVNLQIE